MSKRCAIAGVLAAAVLAAALAASAAETPPCGIPPPAAPKRIQGGEGIPPLPLPATPLRRTERKRDPAPPVLLGKLRWGRRDLVWRFPDGREVRYGDWNHDPNDVHRLLQLFSGESGTKYRAVEMELPGFSFDPEETAILYATGSMPLVLGDKEVELLRAYLLRGGTFLAVAHHSSREFSDSIRALAARLFPGRPFGLLAPDHPIYRAHRRLERVSYSPGTRDRPERAPYLEGLRLGCRVALVLSPYDLCCTWDSDHLPDAEPGVRGPDAFALGWNILSYAIAYYRYGKAYGRWGLAEVEDREVDRGDFVFAQARFAGDCDPHPGAASALIAEALRATSLGARFRREAVSLASAETGKHPFLYMTGHGDFRLSEAERSGLRRYLSSGGFLFADACCGDASFDLAFRRELAAAIPEATLAPLPSDHAIFSTFEPVRAVAYTAAVRAAFPDLAGPFLEGLETDGALRIAYSRFDLGNGWEGEERPFALGVAPADALRIGMNVLVYAMTH